MSEQTPLLPGSTIGVFGSGQLGRMLALAAKPMGYHVATFSPETDSPTGQVADMEFVGAYDDNEAVHRFVHQVDVVTFEFENVPASVAQVATQAGVPVRPNGNVLHVAQNRAREKTSLAHAGLPVTPFRCVNSLESLRQGLEQVGCPAVVKTASFGYDGKGQVRIETIQEVDDVWNAFVQSGSNQQTEEPNLIVEKLIDFDCEVSVVAARGVGGTFASYHVVENIHRNHILDISIVPARLPETVAAKARQLAQTVLEKLDVIGVLCIEFFVTQDQDLLINEIAPRPHNSGHVTIDAAVTSQFEQQLRAVCGLPLGSTELIRPAVMLNLLGDLWDGGTPHWEVLLAQANCKLHLYGKHEARPGRKMGHMTILDQSVDVALTTALKIRDLLKK
ncbi:5-(carboxyamino)imidazole ribonucleotide synthase [Chloroflexi bacterium TSY]|nr:5-(carboxyamino)imidazole ribonucleotide synthase [Chloroflexi bacterium TSY]